MSDHKPPEILFVAGEVGGMGGMEHQLEQLIVGLLESGARVTVIARACELPAHERLEFVRVRSPRRPFAVAYPAFLVAATVLVARRRGGAIVHTTGAMALNRAEVSTVHYCHRGARTRAIGSRAASRTAAYRLNARLAAAMSRRAEAWCYRPRRTAILCAVSEGVASELRLHFPAMRGAVRVIPNGVDAARFKPDAVLRERTRARLGTAADELIALFVGGDWERKGLGHAITALESAAAWRLLVAGPGDPEPLLASARAAGVADRVSFLGSVREMPALYAAADAFVLPTAYETFSLVTYEAAAAGLPLLVTRVSGVEDLLEPGVNGWFIEPFGEDVARRLNELSADPRIAHSMGVAARASALGHSWAAMTDLYLSAYRELAPDRYAVAQLP